MAPAPLHTVFEKRLSKKPPTLPSPTMLPQSILIKPFTTSSSSSSCSSASGSPTSPTSTSRSLFTRRGSDSSNSSSHSSVHDCFNCSSDSTASEDPTASENQTDQDNRGSFYLSKNASTGSDSLSIASTQRRRVQWVDQL